VLECMRVDQGKPRVATSGSEKPADQASKPAATPKGDRPANTHLDALLDNLRAGDRDWSKCFSALAELSVTEPIKDRREEVAGLLDAYLAETNYSARLSAIRAVRVWGTWRNVPALIRMLDSTRASRFA